MLLSPSEEVLSHSLLEGLIRAGLIAALVIFCFQIFHPFLNLMLWSVILAITLYPLHRRLMVRLGSSSRAATAIVLVGLAVLTVPVYLMAQSMTQSVQGAIATIQADSFHIPPPSESVASWPVIGKRVYAFWSQASTDLTSVVQKLAPQVKDISLAVLGKLAGVGVGLLMFLAALIIAGIVMAFGEAGARSAQRISVRLFGPVKGPQTTALCTATIRAVALGVVGIAFIQMLLIGVGFAFMGIPGTGILALLVLLLGIVQLPATLITVPVIVYVLATQGANTATIVFSIYVFVAGLMDNVLKPLLLGRGVDVPMPVVLIGALGGMVTNGIIGLFIGPVVLAVGYQLFSAWVDEHLPSEPVEAPADVA
jgi:predicted PurR-regulated permease PerM